MPLHAVKITNFEGPLDLLLELIETRKLDVTAVSLSQVTDQYLEHIRSNDLLPPDDLAQFLVVASRLILLKSRQLLPQFVLTEEEEESILSLEAQLREYQKFRAVAKRLQQQWLSGSRLRAREGFLELTVAFYPPPNVTGADLLVAITAVVKSLPAVEVTRQEALKKIVSLEERIREIQRRIRDAAVTSFHAALVSGSSKADVVVSFLALLELVKQRIISVEQSEAFRDILIRKRSPA